MCSVSWPLKLEERLEVALFGYKLPATCYFHANISINMTIIYILNETKEVLLSPLYLPGKDQN